MKKIVAVCFVLCSLFSIFAVRPGVRPKVVEVDPSYPSFSNPAYSYLNTSDSKLLVKTSINSDYKSITPSVEVSFIGNNMTLTGSADYYFEDSQSDDDFSDSIHNYELDIDIAAGYQSFAAGLAVSISTDTVSDTPINNDEDLFEYIKKSIFDKHSAAADEKTTHGTKASLDAGLMYEHDNLTVGLVFDDVISYDSCSEDKTPKFDLNSISVGVAYREKLYGKRGSVNPLSYGVALEVHNVLNNEDRKILLGGDINYQFMRNRSLFSNLWYEAGFNNILNGDASAEIGVNFDNYRFALNSSFSIDDIVGGNLPHFGVEVGASF